MTWFFNIFWADEGLEGFPFLDRILFGAVCLIILLVVVIVIKSVLRLREGIELTDLWDGD